MARADMSMRVRMRMKRCSESAESPEELEA
jgi:hypothetical protein